MGNEALLRTKKYSNDELYTLREDIESELAAYLIVNPLLFKGRKVLCPCDDYRKSQFYAFFKDSFKALGLRLLTATCYSDTAWTLFHTDESPQPMKAVYDGEKEEVTTLEGNGDFRSEEIGRLRDECDIICTNPPFSKAISFFRDFIRGKGFIIVGSLNMATNRDIFPLIMEGRLWPGASFGSKRYLNPAGRYQSLGNTCWFTNLPHISYEKPLELHTMKWNLENSPHEDIRRYGYRKYDNYDAIDVPYVDAIPSDYEGIMGVPITYLTKWNEHDWSLVGANIDGYNEKLGIREIGRQFLNDFFAQGGTGHFVPAMKNLCMTEPNGKKTFPYSRLIIQKNNKLNMKIVGQPEDTNVYGFQTKRYTPDECRKAYMEMLGKDGAYDLNRRGVFKNEDGSLSQTYMRLFVKNDKNTIGGGRRRTI